MAFTLPTFNLNCNIFTFSAGIATFRLASPCNLAMGKRTANYGDISGPSQNYYEGLTPALLLPPLTDIRDASCNGFPDIVEVPAGSGRYYTCFGVDDIGKGFTNEHRVATLWKTWSFAANPWVAAPFWPTPIP